jgi:hypothetical protein
MMKKKEKGMNKTRREEKLVVHQRAGQGSINI